ncbi:tricorn protease-like protein [Chitinophaga polysaccharea]|uniref:Tricorn protease-like protein n=1 Tax=Chitinophaga polysaccharea TaxID=1293035 RepID=A0A561Q452_9BACT|nr:S41 family peptidase [Chitinophaga polysaccharea]TWF45154.1 tricorn protease-like protein [Chitinophaga polysaccharea]
MKYLDKYILIILVLLTGVSCRKEMPEINDPQNTIAANFNEVFDAFWNGMNNNYIFWDIDTVNWDNVYKQYKPLFAKLNLNDSNDVRKGYTYFKQMTAGLVDSHYNITFNDTWLVDSPSISPSYERKSASPGFHNPISIFHFYDTIPRKYLDRGGAIRGYTNTVDGSNQYVAVSGTIQQNILYFFFSEFALKELYKTDTANGVKRVEQYFFDKLQNTANIKGIIIDVRGNPGGALADLDFLLGRMIDKQLDFGYTRSKQGNGRLDYSPWAPAFATPQAGARNITAPIVMLADAWSASMAEMTTMAVKALPNGHFVGERTWGANGPLIGNLFFNGGQFTTNYMNLVYTSSLMLKYKDGKIYEGVGFPPDLEVKYDEAALNLGQDKQLEAAIGLIH